MKESVAHGVIYKLVADLSHQQSIKSPQICCAVYRHIIPDIPDQWLMAVYDTMYGTITDVHFILGGLSAFWI